MQRIVLACLFLLTILLGPSTEMVSAGNASVTPVEHIKAIVGDFLLELGLSETVHVSITPTNERLVSVKRSPRGGFLMSFDQSFLGELSEEDLQAAIAHELGHVWIFTHHPYLQTEELANRIALRLVSRECLERIYKRVSHVAPQATGKRINYLPPEIEPNSTR